MSLTNQTSPAEEYPDDFPFSAEEMAAADIPEAGGDTDQPAGEPLLPDTNQANITENEAEEAGFLSRFSLPRIYWKRKHIRGYQVGDLVSELPLLIHPGATLVGNVVAPKVIVAGLLSGSAVAEEVVVANSGQIWGDLFAVKMNVERDGRVHGWISSVSAAVYEQVQAAGFFPDELPDDGDVPEEGREPANMAALRQLQEETAVARAARAELEHDFDRRLSEMAKGATGKISNLNEQVTALQGELTALQNQLGDAQENLLQQKNQQDRQTIELTSAHDLLSRQKEELESVQTKHQSLQDEHAALQAEKSQVDEALEANERRVEQLTDKVHSLEIAHKNSIQHSVDQETALIRWQELAEATEEQVDALETELAEARTEMQRQEEVINHLQSEKKELEARMAALFASAAEADDSFPFSPDAQLLAAQLAELEAEREDEEYSHAEQLLWYKANLETSRAAMESLQDQVSAFEIEGTRLQQELHQKQSRIIELEQRLAEKVAQIEKQAAQIANSGELPQQYALAQQQLAAQEAEIAQYVAATQEQGERLAELQSQLVERDIQLRKTSSRLERAKALLDKQNSMIQQLQTVTGDKIRTLKSELETARRKNQVNH